MASRALAPAAARALALTFILIVLAPAALTPPALAQTLPQTPLDPLLRPTVGRAVETTQYAAGVDLTREEVDIDMRMEFRTVDFDTVNVVFGGGTFQAQARLSTRFEFYVLSAERISDAIEDALPGAGNLSNYGIPTDKQYIAADEFRATFVGEALQAFEQEQEERAAQFITATLPNVTVLSTQFVWSNTEPQEGREQTGAPAVDPRAPPTARDLNDLRLPPLVLDTVFELQYVERTSLLDILDSALHEDSRSEREEEREKQVADAAANFERSAFGMLGLTQVLDLEMEPGWNFELVMLLPQGYTFEEASPEVTLDASHRQATTTTLARDALSTVANPVALTFSNRFVVSTAMLAIVLIAGAILRFVFTLVWNRARRARAATA